MRSIYEYRTTERIANIKRRYLSRLASTATALTLLFNLVSVPVAFAAATINSATVDGGSSTTVNPGTGITGSVNVTTSGSGGSNDFSSVAWAINTVQPATNTFACSDFEPDE